MNPSGSGCRVAILGASSLLGKELEKLLRERQFPIDHLVGVEGESESGIPVLDIDAPSHDSVTQADIGKEKWDFLFLASESWTGARLVDSVLTGPGRVIGLIEGLAVRERGGTLRIPGLEPRSRESNAPSTANFLASPRAATIILATLMDRLEANFSVATAAAQIFESASAHGPEGIEELQNQTLNLLQFQKIPRKIFGAQLAFNLLPRLGKVKAQKRGVSQEEEIRSELGPFLPPSLEMPVPRIFHLPVFYSVGVSLYLDLVEAVSLQEFEKALEGPRIKVRSANQLPPSSVEVMGSDCILAEVLPAEGPTQADYWIWAVADNIRLPALNAVEIAESFV